MLNPDGAEFNSRRDPLNIDPNRDYLKLDSPETNSLVSRVVSPFQPHIVIDLHESLPRPDYDLLFESCRNPNLSPQILAITEQELLPSMQKSLAEKGIKSFRYFLFLDETQPEKGIEAASTLPRNSRNYNGLAQRIAITLETPQPLNPKENLEQRINCHLLALESLLKNASLLSEKIRKTIKTARENPAPHSYILNTQKEAEEEEVELRALKTSREKDPKSGEEILKISKEIIKLKAPFKNKILPHKTIKRPYAYLLPPFLKEKLPKLNAHKIGIEKTLENLVLKVEAFKILDFKFSSEEEKRFSELKLEKTELTLEFPAGCFLILTSQPAGNLISSLLEPESPDSWLTNGCLDSFLEKDKILPIYRIVNPVKVKSIIEMEE